MAVNYSHKPNSGSIRKTKQKKSDNSPDYWGDAQIDGVIYKISGWLNQDNNGNPYLSLKFASDNQNQQRGQQQRGQQQNQQQRQRQSPQQGGDDIPF